jgi:diguanylate cyclase (GGDEF)-like protein
MLDLDNFKRVNDTYGHPVGDELLRRVARVVLQYVRETDSAARYGGEEFAVICPGLSVEELRDRAERLRVAIAEIELPVASEVYRPTVSIGGCLVQDATVVGLAETLVDTADQQLYRAKAEGRDQVQVAAAG